MDKFKRFLTEIAYHDSLLVESIVEAYSVIFEGVNKIIAYHGTNFKLDGFDEPMNAPRSAVGNLSGIYLTTNKSDANEFGKYIYTCELILNNTFEGDPFSYLAKLHNIKDVGFGSSKEQLDEYKSKVNKQTVKEYLISNGYDSVHIRPEDHYSQVDEYIVFNPDSIKILSYELNDEYL